MRCIAYLFNKDYRVYDSLENVYVNLYVDPDWSWREKIHYDGLSDKIYQSIQGICMKDRFEFFSHYYKAIFISYYDFSGRLLNVKFYKVEPGGRLAPTLDNFDLLCGVFRLPASWRIYKGNLETIFFGAASRDRLVYHYIFIWYMQKLELVSKAWKGWEVFYLSCDGKYQLTKSYTLNNE
jgi:hypothetical protein